jgi:Skp family chaperone for outer membrane proteins
MRLMRMYSAVFLGTILLTAPLASATSAAGGPGAVPQQAPAAAAPQQAPAPAQVAAARGASVAWLDLQRIVEASAEGKIANAKVQALTQKKQNEITDKSKQLQAAQQKLQTSGTVLNDTARSQLEKEIDRLNLEIQRMQQDAQAEVQDLQAQLQNDFQKKLMPVIEVVVKERNITLLFSRNDAGIVYGDPGLDLTEEIVKRFDATAAPAAAAPKPPAAAPAPTQKPPAGGQATPPAGNPQGR